MPNRQTLFELAVRHTLDREQSRRLLHLLYPPTPPANLHALLARGVAMLAALLFGLGVIMWVAANWESMGRLLRFGLLQTLVLVMCGGAALRAQARAPLALVGMLGMGALWAYFGQTYQTGADPWQLFALWALLALPLCLASRSDLLWTPWVLISISAINLWLYTRLGYHWRMEESDLGLHLLLFLMLAALCLVLGPPLRRWTGAGIWSWRTALLLGIKLVAITGLAALFADEVLVQYFLALVLLGAIFAVLATPRQFDIFGLSAAALGLDTLLVCGMARLLLDGGSGDKIGLFLLLTLFAVAVLIGTVKLVMFLLHRASANGADGAANHDHTGAA